jgi:hypothetical protein
MIASARGGTRRFTTLRSVLIVDLLSQLVLRASVGSTYARKSRARCVGVVGPKRAK